jgi:hypothetical protein
MRAAMNSTKTRLLLYGAYGYTKKKPNQHEVK